MPHGPSHYCNHPNCPELVRGRSRCPAHEAAHHGHAAAARPHRGPRHYDTARWFAIRARQLAREPLCRACRARGKLVPATDVDHIVALEQGGTDAPENLQSLCHPDHSRKTARQDGGFGRRRAPTGGGPGGGG